MWDLNSDVNSTFFHANASFNKHKNSIYHILDSQDRSQADRGNIKQVFLDHYRTLWSNPSNLSFPEILRTLHNDLPTVSPQDGEILVRLVILAEVFKTLISLALVKSLGLDNFNVKFYKFFGHDVHEDLYNAINYFFVHAHMPNSWGRTFIALIPKVDNPKSVTSYRPFALHNVYYKIIAKILANCLKNDIPNLVGNEQSGFIHGRSSADNIITMQEIVHNLDNDYSFPP